MIYFSIVYAYVRLYVHVVLFISISVYFIIMYKTKYPFFISISIPVQLYVFIFNTNRHGNNKYVRYVNGLYKYRNSTSSSVVGELKSILPMFVFFSSHSLYYLCWVAPFFCFVSYIHFFFDDENDYVYKKYGLAQIFFFVFYG